MNTMLDSLIRLDKHVLLWLNGHHSLFFDHVMFAASGRFTWIPLYILLLVFLVWKYRWKTLWILLAVVLLITLTDQIADLLKSTVHRLRPCRDPEIGALVHIVNHYCSSSFSFFSGHAANTSALAVFISLIAQKKWMLAVMIGWSMLVSYSRIYLGVHYPGDVLAGWIVGTLLAWLIYRVLLKYTKLSTAKSDRK